MKKEKTICWLLRIDKTQDIRFCKKYRNTNELSLEENKIIIDKLNNEGINKICWIGDEALYYPTFIELLEYANKKGIKCELLFNNLFNCDMRILNKIIDYIDELTINIDLIIDKANISYYKYMTDFFPYYQNKVQINVLSMITNDIIEYYNSNIMRLPLLKINTWIMLGFIPILLDENIDIKKYFVSKINYRQFYYSVDFLHFKNIEHFLALTEYSISRYYSIILPNGDIAAINEVNSIIIGNILNDTKEQIDKNYRNKKKYIIPKQSEQKINIMIASSNNKLVNFIKTQIEVLKYVNIIGITRNGKETYFEILNKKPEMVFLQYNFKDLSGYDIITNLADKMQLELPAFNIIANKIPDTELMQMITGTNSKLNAWIRPNSYNDRYLDILKQYKVYRDKD